MRMLADDPMPGRKGTGANQYTEKESRDGNANSANGTTKSYIIRRLARDNPKLLERKAGALLAEMKESGKRATQGGAGANQNTQTSHDVTSAPSLSDLDVTRMESSRWQKIAASTAPFAPTPGTGRTPPGRHSSAGRHRTGTPS